jgi:hypothetical protein
MFVCVDNAEEVAIGVLKDDEIIVWFIGLRMMCSPLRKGGWRFWALKESWECSGD